MLSASWFLSLYPAPGDAWQSLQPQRAPRCSPLSSRPRAPCSRCCPRPHKWQGFRSGAAVPEARRVVEAAQRSRLLFLTGLVTWCRLGNLLRDGFVFSLRCVEQVETYGVHKAGLGWGGKLCSMWWGFRKSRCRWVVKRSTCSVLVPPKLAGICRKRFPAIWYQLKIKLDKIRAVVLGMC